MSRFIAEVLLNNDDTVVAYLRFRNRDPAKYDPDGTHYIVISKRTGAFTDFMDHTRWDYGPEPERWHEPFVTLGHCSLEQPQQCDEARRIAVNIAKLPEFLRK